MTVTRAPSLPYLDRAEAGRYLAERLLQEVALRDPIVLALPRGGVPVAFEVSERLRAPLDVIVVRKLGVPGHEELAMGAIASGGASVFNQEVIGPLRITSEQIEAVALREQEELERREREYRDNRAPLPVDGRQVILVDDGLATGATVRVAARAVRARHAAEVIVAAPVGAAQTCAEIDTDIDQTVCLSMPEPFFGVGQWYHDFAPTTDEEVRMLLERARTGGPAGADLTRPDPRR